MFQSLKGILVCLIIFGFDLKLLPAQSENVEILGTFEASTGINDMWGWNGPDGLEVAIVGDRSGAWFVDITDPADPRDFGFVSMPTTSWHDMKVYKNYAYLVADAGDVGVQIVDLSDAPNSVRLVKQWNGDDKYQIVKSHNVWIDTARGVMYLVGNSARETVVVDITDPENPEVMGTLPGEGHDMHTWQNMLAVSNGRGETVTLWDMQDPEEPLLLKEVEIPNSGYSHNNWILHGGQYMLTTEETSGKTVKMWDISDVENPEITSEWLAAPDAMAHNVYVLHNVAYISHYGNSFRMLDISDPGDIKEVAWHDPDNSSWGAFGGFNSQTFIHGGSNGLLYVMGIAEGIIPVRGAGFSNSPFIRTTGDLSPGFILPDGGVYKLRIFSPGGRYIESFMGSLAAGEVWRWVDNRVGPGHYAAELTVFKNPLKSRTYTINFSILGR